MADDEAEGSIQDENEKLKTPEESSTQVTPVDEAALKLAPPKYEILPDLNERFKSLVIKDVINTTMAEQLSGRSYRADHAAKWVKVISNNIRQRVEGVAMNRFKILVQVSVAEMKGAGLTCALRCIWDPDTDNYVCDSFQNDSLYCHATVFGIYLY